MATKKKIEVKKAAGKRLADYELVFITNPEVTDEALETRINSISQYITGQEGVVVGVERWGKKKLAYPLGRYLEGNYVLAKFQLNPARCRELETNLNISEDVLRHLLVKVEA